MTLTTNYSYNLPTVGGDFETWGSLLNANWSDLDTDLKTANDDIVAAAALAASANVNADSKVSKLAGGDTMAGPLALPATEPTADVHATKKLYVDNGELAHISRYQFSTVLTDTDPGAGKLGFNHANGRLATLVFVSTTGANGRALPPALNFIDGLVIALSRGNATIFYRVASVVDHTTWLTLTVVSLLPTVGFASTVVNAPLTLALVGYLKPEIVVPPYTDYLLSSWGLHSFETVAHGLGVLPTDVRAIFKCKSPGVYGYTTGALLYLAVGSNNERGGYSVSSTTSNVYFSTGNTIYLVARGGSSSSDIKEILPADWDVILRVWP